LRDVVFHRVKYPIESAMESNRLVPSRGTCEQCHWPQKFDSVRLRVIYHFQNDAANTQTQTVLMMLTGGGDLGGIHGKHLGPGVEISYANADPKRQTIPWVEYAIGTLARAGHFWRMAQPLSPSRIYPAM
jgi:hypothetical protein